MTGTGRIGVIGLGSMGLGMALSLSRAGFDVAGCDVNEAAVAKLVADEMKTAPFASVSATPFGPNRIASVCAALTTTLTTASASRAASAG
ncbi:MAG: NAD(P)-dependent oxidoreductase, partial [Rhizobiales bacterium]|nr:NAD(P)-dependent oxidoreductase [Hyphomicrobiales bacterium]